MPVATDPFTRAWAEQEATNPQGIEFDTFEFRHSALNPSLWLVSDYVEQRFKLEANAPVQPNEWKNFKPCPMEAEIRVMDPEDMPQISLQVDNIGRELMPYLEEMTKSREALKLRYRGYLSTDPETVAYGPIELNMYKWSVTGSTLAGVTMFLPIHKMIIPTLRYDRIKFKALSKLAS